MTLKNFQLFFMIFAFQFIAANSESELKSPSIFEDEPLTPSIYKGLEGWAIAEVSLKVTKKFSIDFAQHVRQKYDISLLDKYFTQVGFNYEVFKDFKVAVKGRFISDNDTEGGVQGIDSKFRFQTDISYKHDVGIIDLTYRLSYQNSNELGLSDIPNQYARLRTGVNYKIKAIKTIVKIEGELFNQFQKDNQDNGNNLYRLTVKLNRKIKKNNEIGVFYRIQKDIDRIEPVDRKIIGLKYSHKFDLTK
jgi:hypothetical protein